MRLLVLGGTRFVGRHIVESALVEGHQVTLFNRGRSTNHTPGVELLMGDRDGALGVLEGRVWDAVIDVSGYLPRQVGDSARLLESSVQHYTFVSTVSVYSDRTHYNMTEDAPVSELADGRSEEITNQTYGGLKALCEQEVLDVYDERATIVRPGFVVGPHDYTDRFTYWVMRAARGDDFLVPGAPDDPVQFIDARDLGTFILKLTTSKRPGTYNAVGPDRRLTMGPFIDACVAVGGGPSAPVWASEQWLLDQGVHLGVFPIWLPSDVRALGTVSGDRAREGGLRTRPLEDTIGDTLEWARATGRSLPLRAGPESEREQELLGLMSRS